MADQQLYLMMIRASEQSMANPQLLRWIDELEREYMKRYGKVFGSSLAHIKFVNAPWNFALVFAGSDNSVSDLTKAIQAIDPKTVVESYEGIDLDAFRAQQR